MENTDADMGEMPDAHSDPASFSVPAGDPALNGRPNGSQARKRRKTDGDHTPAEPRRLRRSHEACARCRSKKIKCDSKHPRCTACASAGVTCHQEDRYRQTLTPRGHTERLERQLAQCEALLKTRIEGFDLNNLDDICASEGINVGPSIDGQATAPIPWPPAFRGAPMSPDGKQHYPYALPPPGYPPYPFNPMHPGMHPPPPGYPYGPPPPFIAGLHPDFQPPPHLRGHMVEEQVASPPRSLPHNVVGHEAELKGTDPQSMDMTTAQGISKAFGVNAQIIDETVGYSADSHDREDIAVGSGALSSGRDRNNSLLDFQPRDTSIWFQIHLRTGNVNIPTQSIWLPRDKNTLKHVVSVYFRRLNPHRPVYTYVEFEEALEQLYAQENFKGELEDMAIYDPGFVCSLYLILALGTLADLSIKAAELDDQKGQHFKSGGIPKILLSEGWPTHDEFFDRALIVKADLRITVQSLQALILLHWYLYIERQGRSLWRLVGHLVRLSTELGLHHDPTTQLQTFDESECQMRIRLWAIVMIHDRGTSILLGRPLAIAPSDSSTPRPRHLNASNSTPKGTTTNIKSGYSDHFVMSSGIVDIQADIINSLYTPKMQDPDQIMRHARRITKSMTQFRSRLPESYQPFFTSHGQWPMEKAVDSIVDDNGLTLLKYWIARILMLRVVFGYKQLSYNDRLLALSDAIQTAHNIIVAHGVLIRFPDVAFFVSPIPIHIAAMVILYGHMSKVDCLDRTTALDDVWTALTMLPRFRWRWERKDMNGEHPLISKLAEKVFNVTLTEDHPVRAPRLIPEMNWESHQQSTETSPTPSMASIGIQSPTSARSANPMTPLAPPSNRTQSNDQPRLSQSPHTRHPPYPIAQPIATNAPNMTDGGQFLELPENWFYPSSDGPFAGIERAIGDKLTDEEANEAISMLLPSPSTRRALPGSIGCEPSTVAYLSEERDEPLLPTHMNPWVQHMEQRELIEAIRRQVPPNTMPQPPPNHIHVHPNTNPMQHHQLGHRVR